MLESVENPQFYRGGGIEELKRVNKEDISIQTDLLAQESKHKKKKPARKIKRKRSGESVDVNNRKRKKIN